MAAIKHILKRLDAWTLRSRRHFALGIFVTLIAGAVVLAAAFFLLVQVILLLHSLFGGWGIVAFGIVLAAVIVSGAAYFDNDVARTHGWD